MLRKRIIFTLIHSDGFFMQSRNFRLQKVGDIKWLEKNYKFQEISFSLDELIILDASRNFKDINQFSKTISSIRKNVYIPIAAGGGIRTEGDAELLFKSGADKIVLNSLLINSPNTVEKLVKLYGSQSIIASIDYKEVQGKKKVFINDGTEMLDISIEEYLNYIQKLNIGEIYFNSIEKDGTGFGYDINSISQYLSIINIPLIIAGGAGNEQHLSEGLKIEEVSAVATANLFNFVGDGLPNARKKIINLNINIANWQNYQSK